MSTEIRFYHLERSTLDQALPLIVSKAYEKGHKLIIRTTNTKETKRLSDALWSFNEGSFLPHGTEKDPSSENQPILFATEANNQNNADVLILTAGQALHPADKDFALICDIFDGAQEEQLQAARTRWKALKDKNAYTLSYFQQNERGGWEKKA